MTKPDDRAQDAHPEATPVGEALDGAAPLDDALDENGEDTALDEELAGADAGLKNAAGVAVGGVVAPTTARAGRAGATSRGTGRVAKDNRVPAAPARAQTASDIAVHIDDRASAIFVIAVIAIFGLIFLNALLLGKGGLLAPIATPAPVVVASPAPSAAPSASVAPSALASSAPSASTSAAPSVSPSASVAPSASASPSASGSPKPSASPSPSPAPSPSG